MNELISRLPDVYQWRLGCVFRTDANIVGLHLEHLAEMSGGHLTTDAIANEAQIPTSPIYDMFEHDMETAAFEYQKAQARSIVGNLVIVTIIPAERNEKSDAPDNFLTIDVDMEEQEEENHFITARAFPNVIINGERSYTPLHSVLRDGALRDQYMLRIYNELKALARKASDFKVFSSVVQAVEQLPVL